VIARALRREEIYRGPFAERAPDIVVELALDEGHGLSLVPTPWAEGGAQGEGIPALRILDAEAYGGGRGRGMNGTHRSDGIWIATGPGAFAEPAPARLSGAAPWLAHAMGLAWADEGDTVENGQTPSSGDATGGPGVDRPNQPYSEEEEAMVAERLRALGYLE
jgi:hypothetical protein